MSNEPTNGESKSTHITTSKDGEVELVPHPSVSEREIHEDLRWVTIHLDGVYWPLADSMKPFQEEWDNCGDSLVAKGMLIQSTIQRGASEGVIEWVGDMGEMFEVETWKNAGRWIGDASSAAADRIGEYAKEQAKKIEELIEKRDETLFNWSWWVKQAEETVDEAKKNLDAALNSAGEAVDATKKAANTAYTVWKYREEIAQLPEILASGDSQKFQQFVDTVLMEIDPEMAKETRESEEFAAVLALIDDPDSILTFLDYASMMLEAVPPNFYARLGGKAGAYIVTEILLLVGLSLLGGVGAAARISALTARLASTAVKAAGVEKKLAAIKAATEALTNALKRLFEVAEDLRKLGHKLLAARQRGIRAASATKGVAKVRRKPQKRERRCAICHSTKHATPNTRRGCLEYDL